MNARLPTTRPEARVRRLRAVLAVALAVGMLGAVGTLAFACAPETSPVGPGGECFVASDCEPGLVCVPQRGGARQCSSDLSQVVGRPPPEGGAADTGGDGPADGPPADASGQDTGAPDTGVVDDATAG